jgi:putative membrane protein
MSMAQTLPVADWWGMHGDVGAGWMVLMMTLMVLFWGAVLVGLVWLVRGAARGWTAPTETRGGTRSPLEILERRFAEGAITVEDYRERRRVLANGEGPSGAAEEAPVTSGRSEGASG